MPNRPPAPPPPLLIALPHGLGVSGVTTWAVRLVNGLARAGRACGLVVHPEPARTRRLGVPIDPGVRVTRLEHVPPIDATAGDLSAFLPAYRAGVDGLARPGGGPVVVSPNLHGDCYGIAAAVGAERDVRVVGWQHSDIEYDARVLAHYEPVLSRFVAVSDRIEAGLRHRLAPRAADIVNIPYGVEAPGSCPAREPLGVVGGRPVRLVYAGRLERLQKRVLAMAHLSRELSRRGVEHELTIAGEGPADAELDAALRECPRVRRLPACSPEMVTRELLRADAFVLASRYEGLSVAMLEAMAAGCVPIVTRVESGLLQAIEPGRSGLIAEVDPRAEDRAAGEALAEATERFLRADAAALSRAAWATARDRFGLERHAALVSRLIDEVAVSPRRAWPDGRAHAFTASGPGGSGSVPEGGARRMSEVLARLAGRRVVIHGAGEHTRQLREVILGSPAAVVAFTDDDPGKHGTALWGLPVVSPAHAVSLRATDVVISSWMHQEAVWARRHVYVGLAVHRLYAAE